jgi:UDP-3-O-[3-hydroxymyristoyl] N-acetylglucosamine deacetylase
MPVAPALLQRAADMHLERKTTSAIVGIEGIGLHSGIYTTVQLHPASAGTGIQFVRTDLHHLRIPAIQSSTTALDYATSLGKDDVSIGTVEHLLAAVVAAGITDLDIHIDGPEVPIIDGSALPFVHLIDAAGVKPLGHRVPVLRLRETIEVRDRDKTIRIEPANQLSIHYRIDFDHPAIGKQACSITVDPHNFARKIAPARTFGFARDVDMLRAAGLARGGSVDNCVVLDDRGIMSGSLRFRDEFVRHKIIDLLGDLALIGRPIAGAITAYKGGHALHSKFVSALLAASEAWEEAEAVSPTSSEQASVSS